MDELIEIKLNKNQEPTVSGRELHVFLESKVPYTQWFNRMLEYGFTENVDFAVIHNFVNDDTTFGGMRKRTDHAVKIDMAKELCMIQRNEKGKQARKYFIEVEKEFNSPERIMARALYIADMQIKSLTTKIEEDKPKVLFADAVNTSKTSILIGDLAKILKQNGINTGQKRLFETLRQKGFLIKSGSSKNMPTQKSMDLGLFEVKENTINNPDGSIRITKTTKVTGKGQQYLINSFINPVKTILN